MQNKAVILDYKNVSDLVFKPLGSYDSPSPPFCPHNMPFEGYQPGNPETTLNILLAPILTLWLWSTYEHPKSRRPLEICRNVREAVETNSVGCFHLPERPKGESKAYALWKAIRTPLPFSLGNSELR
jgi:hypothetical protein